MFAATGSGFGYTMEMAKAIPWRDRVIPEPNSGCWLWEGALNGHGYGQITRGGKGYRVPRLAWEEANGPIPEGMIVCHKCDVRACCNPDHLFLGTAKDNTQDALAKGRLTGGFFLNALQTHCKRGHEFTPENTWNHQGKRYCRQCKNERQRSYYARKVRHG